MATVSFDGLDAWITELRTRRAALDRDIADLEAAQHLRDQLAAVVARYGLAQASVSAAPAPSPRRGMPPIPRIPADAARLTPEQIARFAADVRGMPRLAALERLGRQLDDFQSADAAMVLDAAGLLRGKPKNRRTGVYHQLAEAPQFERVGVGRFRLPG